MKDIFYIEEIFDLDDYDTVMANVSNLLQTMMMDLHCNLETDITDVGIMHHDCFIVDDINTLTNLSEGQMSINVMFICDDSNLCKLITQQWKDMRLDFGKDEKSKLYLYWDKFHLTYKEQDLDD